MFSVDFKKIAISIIGAAFFFHQPTRDWMIRQMKAYIVFIAILIIASVPLVIVGIAVPDRTTSSIAFLLTIILFLLTFVPAGIANAALNPNSDDIFPPIVRRIAGWLAFFGWLGIMRNEWLTFWFVIALVLIFFIYASFAKKSDLLDSFVVTFVVIMTLWTLWIWASPDSNRAFNRLVASITSLATTETDQQSIKNETFSMATYARPNRVIQVVYEADISTTDSSRFIVGMTEKNIYLDTSSQLLVFNHKTPVLYYEGQGFIEIKIQKKNGSFVNAKRYWVEADYIDIDPEKLELQSPGLRSTIKKSESVILHKGDYWFTENVFKAGESYRLKVEYGPVQRVNGSGQNDILQPGEYDCQILSPGGVTFRGIQGRPNVKVTVIY